MAKKQIFDGQNITFGWVQDAKSTATSDDSTTAVSESFSFTGSALGRATRLKFRATAIDRSSRRTRFLWMV